MDLIYGGGGRYHTTFKSCAWQSCTMVPTFSTVCLSAGSKFEPCSFTSSHNDAQNMRLSRLSGSVCSKRRTALHAQVIHTFPAFLFQSWPSPNCKRDEQIKTIGLINSMQGWKTSSQKVQNESHLSKTCPTLANPLSTPTMTNTT